jgi:hypothetical protein
VIHSRREFQYFYSLTFFILSLNQHSQITNFLYKKHKQSFENFIKITHVSVLIYHSNEPEIIPSSMNPEEIKICFEHVKQLILNCGEILKEGFKDCGEVMSKVRDSDVVTVYDHRIEEALMDGIRQKYPDHK